MRNIRKDSGSEIQHFWYLCVLSGESNRLSEACHMASTEVYKEINHHSRKPSDTDQPLTGVSPVELDAHVELGVGSAAQHQPLPNRQSHLCRGQGEVMDLVSCGKGREDTAVSLWPIVLLRPEALLPHLFILCTVCTYITTHAVSLYTLLQNKTHTQTHR